MRDGHVKLVKDVEATRTVTGRCGITREHAQLTLGSRFAVLRVNVAALCVLDVPISTAVSGRMQMHSNRGILNLNYFMVIILRWKKIKIKIIITQQVSFFFTSDNDLQYS